MSRYLRALAGADKDVSVILTDSTDVVRKAQQIHQTTPVATAALGRVLTAVKMMGTYLKEDKANVSLMVMGSAHLKKVYGYTDGAGHLKGYISEPQAPILVKSNGKLDVSGVVGRHGKLVVTKDFGFGTPFVGQSDLVSGEIAEDLTHYYAFSEQQPSVISLGVLVEPDGIPSAAGGLMIQPMPSCSEASIAKLESLVPHFRPMSDMIASGKSLEEILEQFLGDMPYKIMISGEYDYRCDCNHDKIESALITVGVSELQKILNEDGKMELSCHFCGKKYHYNTKAMHQLIKRLQSEAEEA